MKLAALARRTTVDKGVVAKKVRPPGKANFEIQEQSSDGVTAQKKPQSW
jgi:hypothetical protein